MNIMKECNSLAYRLDHACMQAPYIRAIAGHPGMTFGDDHHDSMMGFHYKII